MSTLRRENWLSSVIQATWEARPVGWLAVERQIPSGGVDSVAALWPSCCGKVNRGGQAPMTRRGPFPCCNNRRLSSSPSQRSSQPDPVLNIVIVLKMCKSPIKTLHTEADSICQVCSRGENNMSTLQQWQIQSVNSAAEAK